MSIKTLSPYYVSVPLTNPVTGAVCDSYTILLYVWNGYKITPPESPSYEITKINASAATGTEKVDISRIINDSIEFQCRQQLSTVLDAGDNQVWVKIVVFKDDQPLSPIIEEIHLALKGYGFFLEGENPQLPTNKILVTGDEFKVNRNGHFVLPIMASEPEIISPREITISRVVRTTERNFEYLTTSNFEYDRMYMQAREVGATVWGALTPFSLLKPDTVEIPEALASEQFETRVSAFDPATSSRIYSDAFTTTPLKITKVIIEDNDMELFFEQAIDAAVNLEILGYSTPGAWDDLGAVTISPKPFAFSPEGDFTVRLKSGAFLSNEVDVTIPDDTTIEIP